MPGDNVLHLILTDQLDKNKLLGKVPAAPGRARAVLELRNARGLLAKGHTEVSCCWEGDAEFHGEHPAGNWGTQMFLLKGSVCDTWGKKTHFALSTNKS